jgi:hypothetical protein
MPQAGRPCSRSQAWRWHDRERDSQQSSGRGVCRGIDRGAPGRAAGQGVDGGSLPGDPRYRDHADARVLADPDHHRHPGRRPRAVPGPQPHLAQARPFVITVWIVFGLAAIALWLWLARANGQGGNWARILSTVLFALTMLQLPLRHPQPPGSPAGLGAAVQYYGVAVLFVTGWLVGAATVWLLWRSASSTFFEPPRPARPAAGS